MKKLSFLFAILMIAAVSLFAQAPQEFSYQAVVRNANNQLVTSQAVGVRVSILQGGVSGTVVYMEMQTAVTNTNGLITLQIGGGNVLSGNFATIDWSDGPFFLKTETDPTGGTNYSIEGTQQLLSVPYALYANEAGNGFSGDYNDLTNTPQIPTVPTDVSAFNNDAGYITMDSIPDIPVVPTNVSVFDNDAGYITMDSIPTFPTIPTNVSVFTNDVGYITMDSIPVIPTVPTNVSAFTNDAGYITMDSIPAIPTVPTSVSAFTNDAGYITGYTETDPQFNAWNKDYNDLINKPSIPTVPTNVSAFTNDAAYITMDSIPDIPTVPSNISSFTNDAGYITSYTETQTLAEVTANGNSAGSRQLKDILDPVEAYDAVNLRTLTWMIDSLRTEFQHHLQQQQEVIQQQIDSLQDRIEELEENNSGLTTQIQPTVTSSTAANVTVTNITATSATLYGTVSNPGNVTIIAQGFEWKVTQSGTYTAVNAVGTVMSYNLTGLTPNTSYTYRAFVTSTAGTNYGEEITFTTTASIGGVDAQPCPGTPTLTDVDGNTYNTVWIGNQCWMKENLRTTKYADGTPISLGSIESTTTAYRYRPDNNSANVSTNGYLYNWRAVMGNSSSSSENPSGVLGICPYGWHVPSDAEWTELVDYVRDNVCISDSSTCIVQALSATTGWEIYITTCTGGNNLSDNNATGFSALPAGVSYWSNDVYYGFSRYAFFWSATEYGSLVYYRILGCGRVPTASNTGEKSSGLSVRCLRDAVSNQAQPTATTSVASDISASSATLNGTISNPDNMTIIAQGFEWKTTLDGTYTTVNSMGTTMSYNLTRLASNTSYTYRAFVTTVAGTNYGEEVTFTTHQILPTVTTSEATDITAIAATLNGIISNPYNVPITAQGFEWKVTQGGTYTTAIATGTTMSCNLTGLSSSTSYTYRAFVTTTGFGTIYGEEVAFTTTASGVVPEGDAQPCPGTPIVTDVDGNIYNTVKIGGQCWMKENLRTTKYADETSIPISPDTSTMIAYRYYPNNDSSNVNTYGYLYNWPAVMHGATSSATNPSNVQGICPTGWHVPSNAEWTQLTNYMKRQDMYVCGISDLNIAKALVATTGWGTSNNTCAVGNNQADNDASGFSALPAGIYSSNGNYYNFGNRTNFWSATRYGSTYAYGRYLYYSYSYVYQGDYHKSNGYSVRCLRD